jgi:glycosyltransferase involved in cell wall biosynthesis
VLFQDDHQYLDDQYELLTPAQRRLPQIYLEHDPPREHPVDSRHIVGDPDVLLVHCTAFNRLMWDNGATPTRVIDHGVLAPQVRYSGELARGLVIINDLGKRGRRLGADIFEQVRKDVPLDLVGMGSKDLGGLGEVLHGELPAFAARYRFLFNPIRYTSMGLAVIEAMLTGMPVAGLATTEMSTVIRDGENGFLDTDVSRLVGNMRRLLENPTLANQLGAEGEKTARQRFGIERFVADWDRAFSDACALRYERRVA